MDAGTGFACQAEDRIELAGAQYNRVGIQDRVEFFRIGSGSVERCVAARCRADNLVRGDRCQEFEGFGWRQEKLRENRRIQIAGCEGRGVALEYPIVLQVRRHLVARAGGLAAIGQRRTPARQKTQDSQHCYEHPHGRFPQLFRPADHSWQPTPARSTTSARFISFQASRNFIPPHQVTQNTKRARTEFDLLMRIKSSAARKRADRH